MAAFRYSRTDTYKTIAAQLDEKRIDREAYITRALSSDCRPSWRSMESKPKSVAAQAHCQHRQQDAAQAHELRAAILTFARCGCWSTHEIRLLHRTGLVHNCGSRFPGEFDDYIAQRQGNDYRSPAHGGDRPEERALEVPDSYFDMHQPCRVGCCRTLRYKEGGKQDAQYEEKIAWLRRILEWNGRRCRQQ